MRRSLLASLSVVAAVLTATSSATAGLADLACDQQPGDRFYWTERAFCDLDLNGPERAHGIVIWNHGLSGTRVQWNAPVPPTFRLLQMRGWDVIAIKRHNLAEAQRNRRAVERTLAEVRHQTEAGYRKVVLAGQSFGGSITLEAATSQAVFAVVAMAPGVTPGPSSGRIDPSITERALHATKAERVAVVYPRDDALFSHTVRGERAGRVLAARRLPYLLIDETSDITGHRGGTTGRFAMQYGPCLAEFLALPAPPAARFTCPIGDPWQAVRELLMPRPAPRLIHDPAGLPAGIGPLAGPWYSVMGDTVILFALVDGPSPRVLYRAASPVVSGGIREAVVDEGRISAILASRARIVVTPGPGGAALTWTSADGARVLTTTLKAGHEP